MILKNAHLISSKPLNTTKGEKHTRFRCTRCGIIALNPFVYAILRCTRYGIRAPD